MKRPFRGDIWFREVGSDADTFEEIVRHEVYRGVTEHCADCRYIIDLGANIGLATRYFASRYPEARILSVEPDEENFELLIRNVTGHSNRCQTLRAALWSERGAAVIQRPIDRTRFDAICVGEPDGSGELVPAMTMIDIMRAAGFPRIDLLKVDVEGAERFLFRGDASWLAETKVIAIEFHGNSREDSRFDAVMASHGFTISDSDGHTVIAARSD